MTNPSDLIAKLEAAPEGGRELDAEIEAAITGWHASHLCHDRTRHSYEKGTVHRLDDGSHLLVGDADHAPHYTTSLDAALTLVPDGWYSDGRNIHQYNDGLWMWGLWHAKTLRQIGSVCVKTHPALALCIAALKAREAQP